MGINFQLSAYRYEIMFKPTTDHSNSLSQPQSSSEALFNLAQTECLPVSAQQIEKATLLDPTLSRVYRYTKDGWPSSSPGDDLKPFWSWRNELTISYEKQY